VEQLEIALRYELAVNGLNFNLRYLGGLHSAYVRGEALIAAQRYAEAVAAFQQSLDHRGLACADIRALAHLHLGRAFALLGDKTKAKAAYEAFLALWKDADPAIPILQSAKAEYARLSSVRCNLWLPILIACPSEFLDGDACGGARGGADCPALFIVGEHLRNQLALPALFC